MNDEHHRMSHLQRGCLGDGTSISRNAPVRVQLPDRAVTAAAAQASTCALLHAGEVWCWGQSSRSLTPVLIFSSGTHASSLPRFIVAGTSHFCAVTVARSACNVTDGAERQALGHDAITDTSVSWAQRNDDTVW